jgi:hypothetical protein
VSLIWNVRGFNDRAKRDSIKSLVLDLKPSLLCLPETKLNSSSANDVLSILGASFVGFIFCPASRTRGGILVAWRDGCFSFFLERAGEVHIIILRRPKIGQYKPPLRGKRL